jgi:hypothetical protein
MSSCSERARDGYKVWTDHLTPEVRRRVREARYCNEGRAPRDSKLRAEYEADLKAGEAPLDPRYFLV